MQRAQRTFGRFLKRSPNEADVEAMLTDFNDSESMLEKVSALYAPWQEQWWVVAQARTGGALDYPAISSQAPSPYSLINASRLELIT